MIILTLDLGYVIRNPKYLSILYLQKLDSIQIQKANSHHQKPYQKHNNFSPQFPSQMDVFLLIVTIITSIIFVIVNIYVIAIYKHRQQSIINIKNILCLILIMITLIQIEFQPLFLLVDVLNSRTSTTDLTLFWIVLYFSILGNLAFVKPLLTSLYESDQDDPLWKRILWIFLQVIVSVAVFGVFLGMGWLFFGYLNVTFTTATIKIDSPHITDRTQAIPMDIFLNQSITQSYFQTRLTIPCFLLGLLCLFGYPLLICCGSCGLVALPISLIKQFKDRPKYRRTAQAKKIVDTIKQETISLIKTLQQLKRSMARIDFADGWWAKRRKKAQLNDTLKLLESRFLFHRDYYELFHLQLKMQNANPLVYIGKLILGFFCIIFSVIVWLQILLAQLIFVGEKNTGSVFLDGMLIFFQEQNANFVGIAFLMIVCIFLTIATIKGTLFFSNSIPFITIHPIVEGKTWLNSFLFQLGLCVLSSASLVHLMLGSFPYYLRGGEISIMMGQILEGMHFVKFFISNKIFIYGYLIMAVVGGVFVIVKVTCFTQGKSDLLKAIEDKRKKLFGKENANKELHMIEMTQMHVKDKDKAMKDIENRQKEREKTKKKKVKLAQL